MKRDNFLVIISIAIGTALLACMLSSMYAVLINPLPFPQSDRIVSVNTLQRGSPLSSSAPDYEDLVESHGPFSNSVYVRSLRGNVEIAGHPESMYSVRFEGNLFAVFQKTPVLGNPSDLDAGLGQNTPTAILTYPAWIRFFGQDPHVVGKVVHIGPNSYEVRAVLPPEYQLVLPADLWVVSELEKSEKRGNRDGRIYARLSSDISVAGANEYLKTFGSFLQQEAPDTNRGISFGATLLKDSVAGDSRLLLYLLTLGAAIVLCVAYLNAYQLLGTKAIRESPRWSICLALGAGRTRLFLEILKEPLLLCAIGCAFGLFLSVFGVSALRSLGPRDIPRSADTRLVWQVGSITSAISVLTAGLFSLLMLIRTLSLGAMGPLHGIIRSGASLQHAFRAKQQSLLIGQIALSTTLAISIGMVATALRAATDSPLGFNADGISVTDLDLKERTDTLPGSEYVRQVMERITTLPGIESVAATSSVPFQKRSYSTIITVNESTPAQGKELQYAAVSSEFFRTLQSRVVRGRTFDASDDSTGPRVAILNQAAVQALFGNGESLNKQLTADLPPHASTLQVVGIVENIRQSPTTIVTPPIVYIPLGQTPMYSISIVIRSKIQAGNAAIKKRVWSLNANQTVGETIQLIDLIDLSLRHIRYIAFLISLFAGVTVLLSALGIYAAVSQWLSTSQKEIALHLALGATYSQIRNSVFQKTITIAALAFALGLVVSLVGHHTLKSLLYGVHPQLASIIGLTALLLGGVALLASYIPSLRSKFIDPAELLRSE